MISWVGAGACVVLAALLLFQSWSDFRSGLGRAFGVRANRAERPIIFWTLLTLQVVVGIYSLYGAWWLWSEAVG
jgi:hypothetical protein